MAFDYLLDEINKLGDYDETYGQRYWCGSPDSDKPISFNSKESIELTEDSGPIHITADERVEKQSKKGTVYYQLKKVKISGSAGQGAHPPVDTTQSSEKPQSATVLQAPVIIDYLNRIEKKIDHLQETLNAQAGSPEERPY